MRESFHNTIDLSGPELTKAENDAITQEQKIMMLFLAHPLSVFTPSKVSKMTGIPVITSVRRAMTNLTERGWLTKTGLKVSGPLGKPEHTWKLPASKVKEERQKGLFD